jgi:hypothetical protein
LPLSVQLLEYHPGHAQQTLPSPENAELHTLSFGSLELKRQELQVPAEFRTADATFGENSSAPMVLVHIQGEDRLQGEGRASRLDLENRPKASAPDNLEVAPE